MIRRRSGKDGGSNRKSRARVLTGRFGTAPPPPKKRSKRAGAIGKVKDRDLTPAFGPVEAALHEHALQKLPFPVQILRDRDKWLNAATFPLLTGLGITADELALYGSLMAQGAPLRSFRYFRPLIVARETESGREYPDPLTDPAIRQELIALREAFRIALSGLLKTAMLVHGTAGDVQAARTWLETQGALRPPPVRGGGPGGTLVPFPVGGTGAAPVAGGAEEVRSGDVLLRLAAVYMEARAVSDLGALMPKVP